MPPSANLRSHDDRHGFFCYTGTMSSISPIGGAGGGMNPDVNRPKTPEERQAELNERRKKWEAIERDIERQASDTANKTDKALRGFWTDEDGRERVDTRG